MADRKDRKRGLGRGLSALMADVTEAESQEGGQPAPTDLRVPIEQIAPNPNQPRKRFKQDELEDLAASIREKGVIQPLIVRQTRPGLFEIVAGERRWRAAQMAQQHDLPVVVREFTDSEVLEVAIIENIQRADLNAVEEATGYRQLMERFGHTQEKLAEALGKSRSHIANLLRLLSLPEPVQEILKAGDLSAGHARALIPAKDPVGLARQIVKGGLSVRAAEALVRKEQNKTSTTPRPTASKTAEKDADTKAIEDDLSAALRMKVTIEHTSDGEAGKLQVAYRSLDELDTLCRILSGN